MATYYVDATAGSDSNNGLSDGAAWQTITKVNGATLAAGDSVLFKRGETWSGIKLNIPVSGTASARITFGAYGSGAKPIITGGGVIVEVVSTNSKTFLKFEDMAITGATQSNFAAGSGDIICERCDSYDSLDQNFQLVGTVRAMLIDCTSTGAADDGVSIHNTAFVHIKGGLYSENSQGINAASGTGLIRLIAEDAEFLDNTTDAISMPANAVCDIRRCRIRSGPSPAKAFVGDGRITECVFDGSLGGLTHTLIQSNAGVLEIEHCTFWGNGNGQIVPWNNTQVYIRNCIFDDIYRFTANQAGSVTIAENNIVYSATVYGVTGTATGTITSDPLLVDPANGNWSVASGSSALDGVASGTDVAGNAIRTTIGAWQETGTVVLPKLEAVIRGIQMGRRGA